MVMVKEEDFEDIMRGHLIKVKLNSSPMNRKLLTRVGKCEPVVNGFSRKTAHCVLISAEEDREIHGKGFRPIISIKLCRKQEEGEVYPELAKEDTKRVVEDVKGEFRISGYASYVPRTFVHAHKGLENIQKGDLFRIRFTGPTNVYDYALAVCTRRVINTCGSTDPDELYFKEIKLVKKEVVLE